jgi:hypothetical protein
MLFDANVYCFFVLCVAIFTFAALMRVLRIVRVVIMCLLAQTMAGRDSTAKSVWHKRIPQGRETRAERKARKRNERQHVQENKTNAQSPTTVPASLQPARRKPELVWPESRRKKKYRIDVLLPLYLDELVRGESVTFRDKVPDKASPGLAFYQGLKMAADSLERTGARLDVHIHDAGSFRESPDMLISGRKFDSTDLIIGVVEQHDIPVLAGYARKKRINFISALTNYDGWVKDNQYFTMLQPSVKSHCEYMIDEMSKRYAGKDVALLYRSNSLADDNAALYMMNDLYSEVVFKRLQCNSMPTKEVLASVLDTTKPNIIAISILDPDYADSMLALLHRYFHNIHLDVFGMPTWNSIATLRKPGSYRNITVHVTYPFNYNRADSTVLLRVKQQYMKEFGGTPGEMVLRGYETMMWYGTLLRKYGTIFNADYTDLSGAPFTRYRIKPRWDRNGSLLYLENKNIYLSTYQGGIYRTE